MAPEAAHETSTHQGPPSVPEEATGQTRPVPRRPRPETLFLLIGLLWTIGTKLLVIRRHEPDNLAAAMLDVCRGDVVFFSAVALLFAGLHLTGFRRFAARATMLLGAVVLGWSLVNSAWLFATGLQLQPGVLRVLAQDPAEFFPVVMNHLRQKALYAIPLGVTVLIVAAWFGWRLWRPLAVSSDPRRHLRRAVAPLVLLIVGLVAVLLPFNGSALGHAAEVLGFSSHWHAVRRATASASVIGDVDGPTRTLARAGERGIDRPVRGVRPRPNVVIILLESVPWNATSLRDPVLATTPTLRRLAAEGVEFVETRVPVSLTHKAFWSTFTGSEPEIQADYAEAVLVDEPYESLASILGRDGYRSAFFQMARGGYQCAPGLFSNMGFDHAWFRENLQDPSAHLNWINSDDFRMLEPAFDWVDAEPDPFILSMITTAGHDPYAVPASFGPAPDDRYGQFLHAVRYSDALVAEVCRLLEEREMLEDTIVCVIGDHGESFRSEFRSTRWAPFEEVIRVPWVMRWPKRIEAERRVTWPTSQLDVTPTILGLLGNDISVAGFDGLDALAQPQPDRRLYFATWFADSPRGFVEEGRKFVYWPYNGTLFAFDLNGDPMEENPIEVEGPLRDQMILDIEQWRSRSHFAIPPTRFRERFVYEHWRTFSSGRGSWAYYVP